MDIGVVRNPPIRTVVINPYCTVAEFNWEKYCFAFNPSINKCFVLVENIAVGPEGDEGLSLGLDANDFFGTLFVDYYTIRIG